MQVETNDGANQMVVENPPENDIEPERLVSSLTSPVFVIFVSTQERERADVRGLGAFVRSVLPAVRTRRPRFAVVAGVQLVEIERAYSDGRQSEERSVESGCECRL